MVLSSGWFWIKLHLCINMFFRFLTPGWYVVTNSNICSWVSFFCLKPTVRWRRQYSLHLVFRVSTREKACFEIRERFLGKTSGREPGGGWGAGGMPNFWNWTLWSAIFCVPRTGFHYIWQESLSLIMVIATRVTEWSFVSNNCMSYIRDQNNAQLYPALINKYKIIWFISLQKIIILWDSTGPYMSKRPDVTSGLRPQTKPLPKYSCFSYCNHLKTSKMAETIRLLVRIYEYLACVASAFRGYFPVQKSSSLCRLTDTQKRVLRKPTWNSEEFTGGRW